MRFDRSRTSLHIADGLFLQRQADGAVTIAKFQSDLRDAPPVVEQTLDSAAWATAVAAVSASTDSAAAFRAAEELHTKGVQVAGEDQRPDQTDTEVESEFVDRVTAFLESRAAASVTTNPRELAVELMRELKAPEPRGPEPFSSTPPYDILPESQKLSDAGTAELEAGSDQRDPGDENDRTPSPTVETPSA